MLVAFDQQPVFGHHDHHPGGLDVIQLTDGASQLALDGANEIGPLDQVRDAEVRLVEDLKPDAISAGNSLERHLHAGGVNLFRRNEDGSAAAAELVGDLGLIERSDDLGGLGLGQTSVQQDVIAATGPVPDGTQAGHDHQGGKGHTDPLADSQLPPYLEQLGT